VSERDAPSTGAASNAMTPRRFPPPWSVEELDACFVVRDHNGQALAEEPCRKRKQALSLLRRSGAARQTFSLSSFLKDENSVSEWPGREITMKSPLVIVLVAVVLVTVGTLAVMNNACKSSQHAWCAPTSSVRQHIKTGQG